MWFTRSDTVISEMTPAAETARLVSDLIIYDRDQGELPAQLLQTRRIVVDHLQGAGHAAGDLIHAGVDWSEVSELSQLLDYDVTAQSASFVFKSVGHASWDLAAARVALRKN